LLSAAAKDDHDQPVLITHHPTLSIAVLGIPAGLGFAALWHAFPNLCSPY
jgi:hypothetical protein